jgi:hypothetical protein
MQAYYRGRLCPARDILVQSVVEQNTFLLDKRDIFTYPVDAQGS